MSSIQNQGNYVPTFNSNQQVVLDNIEGQTQAVKGAAAGLKLANEALKIVQEVLAQLQAESPERAEGESDESWNARLAKHNEAIANAQKDVKDCQAKVESAIKDVDKAQKELQKMQSRDLPAAEKKDAQEMERYFEQERKNLEAKAQAMDTSSQDVKETDDSDEGESAAQVALKVTTKKIKADDGTDLQVPNMQLVNLSDATNGGANAASNPNISGGGAPPASGI